LTEAVCREIEARSLSFPKNIEVFRENGFPWMRQLLQRLSPRMADKERIIVLTFLSCVGMLMRGEYVVYEHLKSLLAELPIPQSKMVKMRIQVGFQVTQIRNATIFRLDPDISTKHQGLVHRPQIAPKRKREEEDEEKEEEVLEDVQEVDQEEEQPVQPRTLSRVIPASSRRAWSSEWLTGTSQTARRPSTITSVAAPRLLCRSVRIGHSKGQS
jgi:hypothetical protein